MESKRRHFRHFMGHKIKYLQDYTTYIPTITVQYFVRKGWCRTTYEKLLSSYCNPINHSAQVQFDEKLCDDSTKTTKTVSVKNSAMLIENLITSFGSFDRLIKFILWEWNLKTNNSIWLFSEASILLNIANWYRFLLYIYQKIFKF